MMQLNELIAFRNRRIPVLRRRRQAVLVRASLALPNSVEGIAGNYKGNVGHRPLSFSWRSR
jgi:hypothetical protein